MDLKIGPTFALELKAAGVSTDGIAWGSEAGEVICADPAQLAAAEAVLAKHDPSKELLAPLQDEISPRQFFMQAAIELIIKQAEALAFMTSKTLPKILADPISQLSTDQQFAVVMALMGTSYSRSNAFTNTIGALIGKDAAAMDTFWRSASAL